MKDFKERIKELKAMSEEELIEFTDSRKDDIWSFPGMTPPNGAESIGRAMKGDICFFYYMDPEGNLFYETDRGYRWKRRFEETQLEIRIKERGSRG